MSAQGPLVLSFGLFGFWVWCLGLTKIENIIFIRDILSLLCGLIPIFSEGLKVQLANCVGLCDR